MGLFHRLENHEDGRPGESSHNLFFFLIDDCPGSSLFALASVVAESRGYSLAVVRRLLIAVISLVAEHGLWGM